VKKIALCVMAIAALGLLAFGLTAPVDATGCRINRNAVVVQHQAAYVAPVAAVAIATYVPVPLLVPAYGVSYDDGRLQALKAEIDAVRKQNELLIQQLKPTKNSITPTEPTAPVPAAPSPAAPQSSKSHPGLSVMTKSCAACHESSVAKSKGSGIVLLNGSELASLSADLKLATVRSLLKGTMPKGGKVSDEDATLVLDLVSQ
jgi:mono/diheme cytochrome c family protein